MPKVCVCGDADSPAAKPFYQSEGASPLKRVWYGWDDIKRHLKPFFGRRRMAGLTAVDIANDIAHRQQQGIVALLRKTVERATGIEPV